MSNLLGISSGCNARLPMGVTIGHHDDPEAGTGCTVLIYPEGASGGVAVRGGAPATRETDLLDPVNTVNVLHAVVLSGGSAFGLDSASGVMAYLREEGIGLNFAGQCIPIVSAACIFDLLISDPTTPDAEWGLAAAQTAGHRIQTGNIGAGMGASVGKLLGADWAMKSGLGAASIELGDLQICAISVVNALGTVNSGYRGNMLAGVRDPMRPMSLLDPFQILVGQVTEPDSGPSALLSAGQNGGQNTGQNTTISCVLTNATLDKTGCTRVASMAHDGYARTIEPVHTSNDGDLVFTMATNKVQASSDIVGILSARLIEAAIINAVMDAEGAFGLPASRDLL